MRVLALLLLLTPLPGGSGAHGGEPARGMVVAANPMAAAAGLHVLRAGGTAADAAVAVLMVLGVVEPQASGVGGGAVLVHFDAATRVVTAWDGREATPAAIGGGPDPSNRTGGRAVGVPGAVRMLEALHHARGRLPWADLLAPAIQLAERGVPVSPQLAVAVAAAQGVLRGQPVSGVFLASDGAPLPPGSTLTNPALAQTLRAIATGGANGLLRGPIAAEIATTVRGGAEAGLLTTDDLAAYVPRQREAVCAPYAERTVCAASPPASGVVLLQVLGLLERAGFAAQDRAGADAAAMLMQAAQLAAADAARTLADPDFVTVPVPSLLAGPYLDLRARAIDTLPSPDASTPEPGGAREPAGTHEPPATGEPADAGEPVRAGEPAGAGTQPAVQPAKRSAPERGTASIAIVDAAGNAVAATATLGGPFGSLLFVHGFPLNAALADFAADPATGDPAPANGMQPGKRPATAMAPALVLDADRALLAVLGSTGGSRIPAFEAQALAGLYAWGMPPAQALALPHVAAGVLEAGTSAAALAPALQDRGQVVETMPLPSATVVITVTADRLAGAADPRSAGAVADLAEATP